MLNKLIGECAAVIHSDFIAIVLVQDRHIIWANNAMHRVFGYELGELIGLATRQLFFDQENYDLFGQETFSKIAAGKTYSGTIPQKRKDGTTGWYEFNVSGLEGYPEVAVGAIVDRTENYLLINQLNENASKYRSVVEDQTEIITRILPNGTFVFVNDAFCRLLGTSINEVIGQRWQPIAHPDDVAMIEAKLCEITPDNPVVVIENRILSANNEMLWMQFVNRGFFDTSGMLSEIQTVGRDITQLKLTELNLLKNHATLQRAQSVGRIGSFEMGENTESFKITQETARLFGFHNVDQTTFNEWFSRIHPDDQNTVDIAWREALLGAPYDITYRIVVHGETFWIRALAEVSFNPNGQAINAVGTVQDITDIKQIETSLRESDERLEMALAGSDLLIWDWDIAKHRITVGSRLFNLLGYSHEELANDYNQLKNFVHPKDLGSLEKDISSHLQGGTASFENEHRLRHKDGHWVTVESKGKITLRDKDNNPLRMVGTLRDVTQRKRLNEEGMDLLKRIESLIIENSSNAPTKVSVENSVENLTKREKQVLGMIAAGMTSEEIGKKFSLSKGTVISHRRSLMAKLDLHNSADVTRFAIEHDLLPRK